MHVQIFAVDRVPHRLQLAKEFGAEPLDGTDMTAVQAAVQAATGGRGADCVMEAVGSQATLKASFDLLRIGGALPPADWTSAPASRNLAQAAEFPHQGTHLLYRACH